MTGCTSSPARCRGASLRSGVFTTVLWSAMALASPATAAPADRCLAEAGCRKLTNIAADLVSLGRYPEAIGYFEQAYKKSREPRLLLNIGRCHHRNRQPDQALLFYERFRREQPNPEPEEQERLHQFVSEAKAAQQPVQTQVFPTSDPNHEPPPAPPVRIPIRLLGRPTWRVSVGIAAGTLGGIMLGLGAGALASHGNCATPSPLIAGRCVTDLDASGVRSVQVYNGFPQGVPLVLAGAFAFTSGVVLVALPLRRLKIGDWFE